MRMNGEVSAMFPGKGEQLPERAEQSSRKGEAN